LTKAQALRPSSGNNLCRGYGRTSSILPTDGEKGAVFERLTQLYLQITPEYQAELQHVWTIRGARNAQGGEVGREGSRAVDRVRREVEDEARRVK
jgi:predicted helicase